MREYLNCLLLLCYYWHDLAPGGIEGEARKLALANASKAEDFCHYNGISSVLEPLAPAILGRGNPASALSKFLERSKEVQAALKGNLDITDGDLNAIRCALAYLSRKSGSNWFTLVKNVAMSQADPLIVRSLRANKEQPGFKAESPMGNAANVKALRECVRKLTGTSNTFIPVDMIAEARQEDPLEWKNYLALSKAVRDASNALLLDASRAAKGKLTIDDAARMLKTAGLPVHLPIGFTGFIGENGALFTKSGRPIQNAGGQPVYKIDPGARIVMNPSYREGVEGSQWVFKAVFPTKNAKGRNNEGYYYTDNHRKTKRASKFAVVEQMLEQESAFVRGWRKDLLLKRTSDKKVYATMCELIYDTCARVGSSGNANRKGNTYGITTLLARHVTFRGTGATIKYTGKDAVVQQHRISPATAHLDEALNVLDLMKEGKKPNDPLWVLDGRTYNANGLRAYFRTLCSVTGASPHKIRHLRGTRLALELFDQAATVLLDKPAPPTEKQVHSVFQTALLEVGKILGHVRGVGQGQKATWVTAAKSYVDVSVMVNFYDQFAEFNIRPPAFLSKLKDD